MTDDIKPEQDPDPDREMNHAKVLGAALDKAMFNLFGGSGSHMHAPYYDPDPKPLPESGDAGGMKYDAGKPLAGVLFADFPRALKAVVDIGTFGAKKYQRSSWKDVPNAEQRYTDALYRHLLETNINPTDAESGMSHLAHAAWGILATLELQLQREAGNNAATVSCEGSK